MKYEVVCMPKKTYYNLNKMKQTKIVKSGITEFTNYSINNGSVNRIVKRAGISKGSFYQYFYNKDEFYWYIVKLQIKDKITSYETLLEKYDGDIFKVEELVLKELLGLSEDYRYSGLLSNLFIHSFHDIKQKVFELDEVNFNIMYQIYIKHKKQEYKVKNHQEFSAFFDMLRTLSTSIITGVIRNSYNVPFALDMYDKQIGYIKRGLKAS